MATVKDLPARFHLGTQVTSLKRIAVLEDKGESEELCDLLERNGMTVSHRDRPDDFLKLLARDSFDAIIISWGLSDSSGYVVLRRIRDDMHIRAPILMLTSRSGEFEVVQALNGGANDCITKPWRPFELIARLNAMLRTEHGTVVDATRESYFGWTFDSLKNLVSFEDFSVRLPHKEFEVARFLFKHLGSAVSREHLNKAIWNGAALARTVDTHVSRVRMRLRLVPDNGYHLQSIYGFGYRLDRWTEKPGPEDGREGLPH